jgi:hypothetical protein
VFLHLPHPFGVWYLIQVKIIYFDHHSTYDYGKKLSSYKTKLVSSVFLYLLHSFGVCFYIFPTRLECGILFRLKLSILTIIAFMTVVKMLSSFLKKLHLHFELKKFKKLQFSHFLFFKNPFTPGALPSAAGPAGPWSAQFQDDCNRHER